MLQRSAMNSAPVSEVPPSVYEVLHSSGLPLDTETRTYMEPKFGHDFSDVRVHTDAKAAESAEQVSAFAFTVGSDIVFGARQYSPRSTDGQKLLAHELTHVIQQGRPPSSISNLSIAPSDSPYEMEAVVASSRLDQLNSVQPSLAKLSIQRQPAQQSLRDQICYQPSSAPQRQAGDCDVREPENCPTYELWINAFRRLFIDPALSRDTAPGGIEPTADEVIGQLANRPVDDPKAPAAAAPPPIRPQVADRFIDHPTDLWVQTCLPPNLRETAYRLPADCADIAVILRHVWLSAHHRTETYGHWVVGDRAGGARQEQIGRIIGEVYSGNVATILNAYSDPNGQPLRTFADVGNLLHPGDILVWEHHDAGLGTARTGGDTETIMNITRVNGHVTQIDVVQGNQPIFEEQAQEIREHIGRGAPSERTLRDAPGRRIEVHHLQDHDLRDLPMPPRRGHAAPPPMLWTLADGDTTLIAAGPPRAAARPSTHRIGGQRIRRISDWFPSLRSGTLDSLPGILEAALLELRAMIEGGQTGLDTDAATLGQIAGERLWNLARRAGGLGEESHFRPLQQLRAIIAALGDPAGQRGFDSSSTPQAASVQRVFNLINDAFHLAARGGTTISFNRRVARETALVRVLVTGFDPFLSTGAVPPGVINPSGAAALALDNTTVSAGSGVMAAVEGVVLPVSFGDFRRGMVENIVRPLVQNRDVDAILTVSLDESLAPTAPVRLERFVVGVHEESGQLGSVPAAQPGGLGPAIIETPAPIEDIARNTARPGRAGAPTIAQPTIGTDVTFRFPTSALADRALTALGFPPIGDREVTISDVSALQQIISTMQRAANGVDITFQIGGQSFQATVVDGPGGNFLSNEVSYRVLRWLLEQQRQDILSFHVHTARALPNVGDRIPQDTSTGAARATRRQAIRFALGVRDRLIATLQSMIRVIATRVRSRLNPGQQHTP
jgi:Domain of unknown function (DUF4157)